MITHTGPNRYVVLTVYVALVVAALLLIGGRLVPPDQAADPTSSHSASLDPEAR